MKKKEDWAEKLTEKWFLKDRWGIEQVARDRVHKLLKAERRRMVAIVRQMKKRCIEDKDHEYSTLCVGYQEACDDLLRRMKE